MRRFIVFATQAGDLFCVEAEKFWKYTMKHRDTLDEATKIVCIKAYTKMGALSDHKAYPIYVNAVTHRRLTEDQ